jgi:hypothetical protein
MTERKPEEVRDLVRRALGVPEAPPKPEREHTDECAERMERDRDRGLSPRCTCED